jgi:outer membrane protein assembly factor BamB
MPNGKQHRAGSKLIAALVGLALLGVWLGRERAADVVPSLPGMDGQPAGRLARRAGQDAPTIDLRGVFVAGDGVPADLPGRWPRFRGAAFDNIVHAALPLADAWPADGPELLWTVEMGEGYAAAAVFDGRVFVLDYDEAAEADALRCLSLADGREIWRRSYRVPMKRNHGLSRTIPAVSADYVVSIGPRCHVLCVDMGSGGFRWGIDLQREYGSREPFWYAGQCPLIDDGVAVLAPAGPEALLLGVDCQSGEILWRTPNPDGWQMSHSSVMPVEFGGVRMYVYCAIGGVVGVAADGPGRGQALWKVDGWRPSVLAPSPVMGPAGHLFVTAGYGFGSALIQLSSQNGQIEAVIVDQFGPKEGLACEQQTPVLVDGRLYGIMPKDAGSWRGQFVCAKLEAPRELLWGSGRELRFGLGPFLYADGKFLILDDSGTLTLLRPTAERAELLASAKLLHGRDAWGPLALVGDRLLLRDDRTMICVRLPTRSQP